MYRNIKSFVLSCVLYILNLNSVLLDKVNDNEDSKQKPTSSEDSKDTTQNNDNNEQKENKFFEGEMDLNKLVNLLFVGLVVVVIILKYISSKQSKTSSNQKEFQSGEDKNDIDDPDNKKLKIQYRNLKLTYFPAYFAAIFGDWIQGPYVYRLYSEYGFQENQIAILFLNGFGSSFTFGTFTGPLADKFGRKSMTQVFCFL